MKHLKNSQFIKDNIDFISELVEFDKSLSCSLISRYINQTDDFTEAFTYLLDRYILSTGSDVIRLSVPVFESHYEKTIDRLSHNVNDGTIAVHFQTGGYADFYNISKTAMKDIVNVIVNSSK